MAAIRAHREAVKAYALVAARMAVPTMVLVGGENEVRVEREREGEAGERETDRETERDRESP